MQSHQVVSDSALLFQAVEPARAPGKRGGNGRALPWVGRRGHPLCPAHSHTVQPQRYSWPLLYTLLWHHLFHFSSEQLWGWGYKWSLPLLSSLWPCEVG